jgi:hypothetical protein
VGRFLSGGAHTHTHTQLAVPPHRGITSSIVTNPLHCSSAATTAGGDAGQYSPPIVARGRYVVPPSPGEASHPDHPDHHELSPGPYPLEPVDPYGNPLSPHSAQAALSPHGHERGVGLADLKGSYSHSPQQERSKQAAYARELDEQVRRCRSHAPLEGVASDNTMRRESSWRLWRRARLCVPVVLAAD